MPFTLFEVEIAFFYVSVAVFIVASVLVWAALLLNKTAYKILFISITLVVFTTAVSITLRWIQTGHGPFMTLYDVLLSNLFTLGFIFLLTYKLVVRSRPAALFVLPLLALMAVWAATTSMTPVALPETYNTVLLWIHVGVGKVFLGLCLTAFGLAAVLLMRHSISINGFKHMPASMELDDLAWRFMAVAFVFHSLMLIAGAVWAQDAWGRFWAWDSLETWAFITWLVMGLSLHARVTWSLPAWTGWLLIITVFMLAMLTFLGVPFSSIGPHKGIM
ncbi:cytochrome c biogenesis protein CcsA [Cardiobacterium sp. AH-315-I02]|nr:cytochrome c biogenesis protein CcsA [Cardiobacterium sp. AH-315-I02]